MTAPEFSRPLRIDTLGEGERAIALTADAGERAALARRFGLTAVDRLDAQLTVRRKGEDVFAAGHVSGGIVQACVATGDPVPVALETDFTLRFVPGLDAAGEEVELDADDLDVVTYEGSAIDLGEAVAETLLLALDPFPRAPHAQDALKAGGVVDETDVGPFAALKGLRDKLGG